MTLPRCPTCHGTSSCCMYTEYTNKFEAQGDEQLPNLTDYGLRMMAFKIVNSARQPERDYLLRRSYVEAITEVLRTVRDGQRERDA